MRVESVLVRRFRDFEIGIQFEMPPSVYWTKTSTVLIATVVTVSTVQCTVVFDFCAGCGIHSASSF